MKENLSHETWAGARWWRFDFHTHTPASTDFEASQQSITPKEWLLSYMNAEIDCVAVTDHNTGAWVDSLKNALQELESEKPEGYRPLTLFPGVEISACGNVHVLAIFPPCKSTSDIDSLLGAVGFRGTRGDSDEVTSSSLVQVIHEIQRWGGLAIPAHADKRKGLFNEVHGTDLETLLGSVELYAVEVCDKNYQTPELYTKRNLNWTRVLGSDSHRIEGNEERPVPGCRYTWVKMESPSFEGLRLALMDQNTADSIRRSDVTSGDPNLERASSYIELIRVSEAQYLGRSTPLEVPFNPWLSTIIGGRGTGKSTLVEFLRIALGRVDELPDELKNEFEKYRKPSKRRNDDGLLTEKTTLSVIYRKEGQRYRIQWNESDSSTTIEEEQEDGTWTTAEGLVQRRFPAKIYSQKQIYWMASQPAALLKDIDEAPAIQKSEWNQEWERRKNEYARLKLAGRELAVTETDYQALKGDLADLTRRIKVYEEKGYTETLKAYQGAERERQAIENWEVEWKDNGQKLREIIKELLPTELEIQGSFIPSESFGEMQSQSEALRAEMNALSTELTRHAHQWDQLFTRWETHKQESPWLQNLLLRQKKYEELQKELEHDEAPGTFEYRELLAAKQTVESRLEGLDARRKKMEVNREELERALEAVHDWRLELTQRRQRFLSQVLHDNQHVKIRMKPFADMEDAEKTLRECLGKSDSTAFDGDIGRSGLLGVLYTQAEPDASNRGTTQEGRSVDEEVGEEADRALERIIQLKNRIENIAAEREEANDRRFQKHLSELPENAFDQIDLWFPEDSVYAEYRVPGSKENYRSIQSGSPGQKTSALLAFLMAHGDEPLILDQPEDDLDNRLIYELIVSQLKEQKLKRQIIIVTHNPNIVVNADAELVLPLEVKNGRSEIVACGSLQNLQLRQAVCAIMEGGQEAFERRYQRIAIGGKPT